MFCTILRCSAQSFCTILVCQKRFLLILPAKPVGFSDYLELTKPRLSLLSVMTALAGLIPAARPPSSSPWRCYR